MALDTTIGGAAADSFGTLAEADAYFAKRLGGTAAWGAYNDTEQESGLIEAARAIGFLEPYLKGKRTRPDIQALAYPRYYVPKPGSGIYSPIYLDNNIIPAEIKSCQFEWALAFLQATVDLSVTASGGDVQTISIEGLSVTLGGANSSTSSVNAGGLAIPARAYQWLQHFAVFNKIHGRA